MKRIIRFLAKLFTRKIRPEVIVYCEPLNWNVYISDGRGTKVKIGSIDVKMTDAGDWSNK
jgi:hypothetical protein